MSHHGHCPACGRALYDELCGCMDWWDEVEDGPADFCKRHGIPFRAGETCPQCEAEIDAYEYRMSER